MQATPPALNVPYIDLVAQFRETRQETLEAVEQVFRRGDFILGEEVDRFERRFAEFCGVRHAVGVANGTEGLALALKSLGVGPGDEVITVPNSFIATASAIVQAGARPVFVDVLDDMLMDTRAVERAINPRTRAIIPVHLAGKCVPMDDLLTLAQARGIPIVEDAAQSIGTRLRHKRTGSFGAIGVFSLHPLKNLNAAGDAGILTTQDDLLAKKLRMLRNHGLKDREEVSFWGFNSRLDSLQAAILNRRFVHLEQFIEKRRRIAERYRAELSRWVVCPQEGKEEYHTYHLFVIQAERRDALQQHLRDQGIETKIHYPIPIHLQACASDLGYKRGDFPVCERLAARILSLPVHPYLSDDQIGKVCGAIGSFYGGKETAA